MENRQKQNLSGVFHGIHDIQANVLEMPEITPKGVIIQVKMAGICGSDLHFYHEGNIPEGSVLGHEFTGVIHEVGDNVTDFKVGQRVIVNPMIYGTGLGLQPGGFADFVLMDNAVLNENVFIIPDSIDDERGALMEPLTVGMAGVRLAKLTTEEVVLVMGCGTIGLVTIAALKAKGVSKIIASDISDMRLEMALKLGASETFNPTVDGDLTSFIKSKYGVSPNLSYSGEELPNLDVVFECSGVSALFTQAIQNLATNGKMVILSIFKNNAEISPNLLVLKKLTIKGSLAYTSDDFADSIELVSSGKIDLRPIVTHRFPLSEISKAFETQADTKSSVKVLLQPNSN